MILDHWNRPTDETTEIGEATKSTIVVQTFIALDGVVQAAGGPREEREGSGTVAMRYEPRT
jgi:hypothetical protein